MTSIKTERHLVNFYLSVFFGFVAFTLIGVAVISIFAKISNEEGLMLKHYLLLVFGIGCIAAGVYGVIRYFKNAPIIEADRISIRFDDEIFFWENAEEIELTGKKPFPYFVGFPMEGTMIQFKGGRKKYFYDSVYSNGWKLKLFIEQVIIQGNHSVAIPILEGHDQIRLEHFETYKGNQFTSLRGITLWGMIGILFYLGVSKGMPSLGFITFASLISLFWFSVNSYLMYYFDMSDKHFVVKNHNFIWVNKVYQFDNIKEVVFETQGKLPNCLRIITKDFRNKLYPAGTLRDDTWRKLKIKLEEKGIVVRDECIGD